MWRDEVGPQPEDVSAAALVTAPFLLALLGAQLARPFSASNMSHADPIVQTLGGASPWITLVTGVALIAVWVACYRPDRETLKRAGKWALVGAAVAALVAGGLRLAVGDQLPGFIPPEESAKPGLALGLSAGLLEELGCRLAILPLAYAALRRRVERTPAVVVSVVVTALVFVLSHELPPAGGAFEARFLATRFLFPGAVMSLAFWWISPAFIVSAHLTGHLLIASLFV